MFINTDKYSYLQIYESIAKYYPIGIPCEHNPAYNDYSGSKERLKLLEENILIETNFSTGWVRIESEMQTAIGHNIIGTTYGNYPSYSSYIEIEKNDLGDLIRYKEIYFFISLLGPFYTVVGQDRNEIRAGNKIFRNTNFLIVSPENEFEVLFEKISKEIESRFIGYKYVPFFIYSQVIDGLYTRYRTDNQCTIFEAIFDNQINLDAPVIGNTTHKLDGWINDGYDSANDSQWTLYAPYYNKD